MSPTEEIVVLVCSAGFGVSGGGGGAGAGGAGLPGAFAIALLNLLFACLQLGVFAIEPAVPAS